MDATDSCSAESSGKGDNLPPGKGLRHSKDLENIHEKNGPGIFDQVYIYIYITYYLKIYVYIYISIYLYSCIKHISINRQINTPLYPMFLPKRCDVIHRPEVSRLKFLLTFAWFVPLVRFFFHKVSPPIWCASSLGDLVKTSNAESMVH